MTRILIPAERVPLDADDDGVPISFAWRGRKHTVVEVVESWRADAEWWRVRQWREHFIIATNTRRNRSISVSMLAASNTSVRNSTAAPIPACSPSSVQRSESEIDKSIRAVWVSTGSVVTCTSSKVSFAGGFSCRASNTWTNG